MHKFIFFSLFQLLFRISPLNITVDSDSNSSLFLNSSFAIFPSLDEAFSNIANNSDIYFKIELLNASSNKNLSIRLTVVELTKSVTISSNSELMGISLFFINTQISINGSNSKLMLKNLNLSIMNNDFSSLFQVKGGGTLVIKVLIFYPIFNF